MQRKYTSNEKGVVMMETIITLPLYLILLFGLFVLGDYCMIRLKLNNNERVRHWESGLRHTGSQINANDLFMGFGNENSEIVGSARGLSAGLNVRYPSSLSWSQVNASAWRINVSPSDWSANGSTSIINNLWTFLNRTGDAYGSITGMSMYARSRVAGNNVTPVPTVTLSRLATNNRNNTYQGNWFNIFSESYDPDGNAPVILIKAGQQVTGSNVISAYGRRNRAYESWSE